MEDIFENRYYKKKKKKKKVSKIGFVGLGWGYPSYGSNGSEGCSGGEGGGMEENLRKYIREILIENPLNKIFAK